MAHVIDDAFAYIAVVVAAGDHRISAENHPADVLKPYGSVLVGFKRPEIRLPAAVNNVADYGKVLAGILFFRQYAYAGAARPVYVVAADVVMPYGAVNDYPSQLIPFNAVARHGD